MTELRLAFRDRADSLSAVADAANALSPDEARVQRQLVLDAAMDGVATAGDLLDHLERLAPAERRALLDRTRVRAGLPPLREARKTEVPPVAEEPERDQSGYAFQNCAVCGVQPLDPSTGAPLRTRARRWHCSAHEHLAAPGDLDDWTSRIVLGPSGYVDLDALEAERLQERREAEARAIARTQRLAARAAEVPAAEAEALAEDRAWRGANLLPIERTP